MDKNYEDKIRYTLEELIGKGNLGIVDETFTTDYVAHAGEKEYSAKSGIVELSVYNVLGEKVLTLVNNEEKSIGTHEVTFDAGNLASGVYYGRLQVGDFTETKKMIFLR